MKKVFVFLIFFFITFVNVYASDEYVTKIMIDKIEFTEFDPSKESQEYTIDVPSNKDKIIIAYVYDDKTYIGQGTSGEISLGYGSKTYTFTLINQTNNDDKKTYKMTIIRKDDRSDDNSLTSLTVGGSKVVIGTSNEYTVDVNSKLTGITIEAKTNNDKATFIDGYGPRTLSGDATSAEIKVKAENGDIRTYKINITKNNAKSSDATLKILSIDKINFDFKSTTFEYKLNANYDISKIKITAVPTSDKASLEYKEEQTLTTGENIFEIKVSAEDGSLKTYKLIITKEEKLSLVSDIKIKDVDFKFDSKVFDYTIETTLNKLDFDIVLNKDTAKTEITGNENLKNGNIITLEVEDGEEIEIYKFKILNNSNVVDNKVSRNVSKFSFFKANEMIIGLAVFGIGLFSLLVAILLKPKSQIM